MILKEKVALITGAAQGLGKGFAEALLKKGAKVCLLDLNTEQGEKTLADFNKLYGSGRSMFVKCDVTSQNDMENAFSKCKSTLGKLDIVVNNAGLGHELKWNLTVDINVKGVISGTMLAIESLRKDEGGNGGVIINMASTAGLIPVPFAPVYCATKHAIVGYTRSWAAHLDRPAMGIRFGVLCPAFVETQLLNATDNGEMYHPDKARAYMQHTGIMSVEYVAGAFIQLLEDDNTNGAVMKISKKDGIEFKKFS